MRIAIIGSTGLQNKMRIAQGRLMAAGHECRLPEFDSNATLDALGIAECNRDLIKWSEQVNVFWDQRSPGTIFDFAMAFALRKVVVIEYMEKKTISDIMYNYADISQEEDQDD